MIVDGMMRTMPYPKETMHHVLMGEPGNKFPEEKCCSSNDYAKGNGKQTHGFNRPYEGTVF